MKKGDIIKIVYKNTKASILFGITKDCKILGDAADVLTVKNVPSLSINADNDCSYQSFSNLICGEGTSWSIHPTSQEEKDIFIDKLEKSADLVRLYTVYTVVGVGYLAVSDGTNITPMSWARDIWENIPGSFLISKSNLESTNKVRCRIIQFNEIKAKHGQTCSSL